jgi:hypothetical protein
MDFVIPSEVEEFLDLLSIARVDPNIRDVSASLGMTRSAGVPKMIDNLFNSFTCHAVPGRL